MEAQEGFPREAGKENRGTETKLKAARAKSTKPEKMSMSNTKQRPESETADD
jgi:hypothetical protein